MPFSKKQLATLDSLRAGKYDDILLRDVSSAINAAFSKNETRGMKKLLIKGGVDWYASRPENKDKDPADINKIIVGKIKTKEAKNEAREIFKEIINEDEKEEEEKHDEPGEEKPLPPMATAAARTAAAERENRLVQADSQAQATNEAPPPAPEEGVDAVEYRRQEMMADARADENREIIDTQDDSVIDTMGKYIDKGSQYYKDNKKTINKVLNALTPKKIANGSYLTELASLEFPEIAVFQKAIKVAGLGFTKDDKKKFAQLLSRDPDERSKISDEDSTRIMLKALVNPDQIGVLLQTRGGQLADDAAAWWKKLTNQPRDLSKKDEDVKEKIDDRREETKKGREKESALDDWFGVKDEEQKEPPSSKYDIMDSYSMLIPPDDKLGENTAGQDVLNVIRSIISFGGIRPPTKEQNKEEYLKNLEENFPEQFQQYTDAMNAYTEMRGKIGLDKDSAVNYETSKDYVDSAKDLTQDLIKKAIASGKLDRKTADSLYDIWSGFDDIAGGESQLTYGNMEQIQAALFKALPRDIIMDNSDAINEFMSKNMDSLNPNFDGDSDLGDFDWLKNILDPPDELNPDGTPKEKKISKFKPSNVENKYRYRGRWGDTDEVFQKMSDDVEKRNLVIEVQRLRESVDTTNKLVQSQLMSDRMRYDSTFSMPPPPPSNYKPLPEQFKREHRAIFAPAVIQNPLRDFERNTRDECYYGQYQGFHPAVMPTSARQDLLTNPLVYPSNADMATGGELQEVGNPTLFDIVKQSRFEK